MTRLFGLAGYAVGVLRRLRPRGPALMLVKRASTLTRIGPAGPLSAEAVLRRYMLYFMLPLWFVPGILDYLWHRRTRIETTSGVRESIIHALMMTEVGVPIIMGLLLEINAGVILVMIAAYFLHQATAVWDVSFAVERRKVMPREQHTHSFLEMLPFCAVSMVLCLHWDQFEALWGNGRQSPRFSLQMKNPPLPARYVTGILSAIAVCIVAPYAEELARCAAAEKRGLTGTETPECAPILFGSPS